MDLQKLEQLIRPVIEGNGYTLYDVEFIGRILRISIENPEGNVSVNDCVETSRLLNPLLDVEDVIPGGSYDLEVSSPGLDRNLRRPDHFKKAMGETIHVTTRDPLTSLYQDDLYFEKRRNFHGLLSDATETELTLSVEGGRNVAIPYGMIARAYVDFEIKTKPKKGKKV